MWSSRIFSLVGRAPPAQFVSPTNSRLPHRTFVTPAMGALDRANAFPNANCSKTSNLPSSQSLLPSFMSLPFHETRRCMSKYLSKSATKRLPLSTKWHKKGFYKGKGGTKEGRLTSKGKFIADPLKKVQLIVPDLEGFTLKPYIANSVSRRPPETRTSPVPGQ